MKLPKINNELNETIMSTGLEIEDTTDPEFSHEKDLLNIISMDDIVISVWKATFNFNQYSLNDARLNVDKVVNKAIKNITDMLDKKIKDVYHVTPGTSRLTEIVEGIFDELKVVDAKYGKFRMVMMQDGAHIVSA